MKSIVTIILLFLAITVNAATLIDGIYYNLDNTALTAEVTYQFGHQYSGSISIPATVVYKNKSYKVTSIGNSAFNDCSDLTSIDISDGVTRIGGWCFAYCSNLKKIRMPSRLLSYMASILSIIPAAEPFWIIVGEQKGRLFMCMYCKRILLPK